LKQPSAALFEAQSNALDRTFRTFKDISRSSRQSDVSIEILSLFALKFMCDREIPGGWLAVVHEFNGEIIKEQLTKLAYRIEDGLELLSGVFTKGLLPDFHHFDTDFLRHIVFELSAFFPSYVDEQIASVFARWFDRQMSILMESSAPTSEAVTPSSVARLMIKLSNLQSGMTVLDPCCGIGTILSQVADEICETPRQCFLYGQEINIRYWALCKLRLFLFGCDVGHITLGDTLRRPAFVTGGEIKHFDRVMGDVPLGGEIRGEELGHHFRIWRPGKISIESAFIQYVMEGLKSDGIGIVLVSHSFLFRSGIDARVREMLIEPGYLNAVIGLPARLRAGTTVETALIVLRKQTSSKVFLVDAVGLQERVRGKTELSDETNQKIYNLMRAREESVGVSRLVAVEEIRQARYSLIPRHYISAPAHARLDIESLRNELESLEGEYQQTVDEINRLLKSLVFS
jgi:type I restriction-modification system DNA methylase subunit